MKFQWKFAALVTLWAASLPFLSLPSRVHADRLWWDGTRDSESAAPGKLLSDNDGYWGDCVLTGVEYHYTGTPPDAPADSVGDDHTKFGRRLLDGAATGDWHVPVGAINRPLVTVFDFKRACLFRELDLATQSNKVAVTIECADAETGPWRDISAIALAACPDKPFHRFPLPVSTGRFLRLTVQGAAFTYLNEVLVWGDAAPGDKTPEAINPVTPPPAAPNGTAFSSLPGIPKTTFADSLFHDWQHQLGGLAKQPAVWSRVPTWDSITDKPLLPATSEANHPVTLAMARNETQCAALALTNTSLLSTAVGDVALSAFRSALSKPQAGPLPVGQVRAAGTIGSRWYGVNVGPLFAADNKLGPNLMHRYLTNSDDIKDFPRLSLPPAGSAVCWLSVTTANVRPGIYQATLRFGSSLVPVRLEVLDVTLPHPRVWVNTWSGTTPMFPFVYGDRPAREVAYKQDLGVTVWNGLPTPGSDAALARQPRRTVYQTFILPWDYVNIGYNNKIKPDALTPKDQAAITAYVHGLVTQAKALGLTYDDWYGELWDEPGVGNAAIFGAMAQMVHEADPHVRLYCNPCFWVGSDVTDDAAEYAALQPWYSGMAISVPLSANLYNHPKSLALYNAPRPFRAFYGVDTASAKSERAADVERYRRKAWDAFARGWNGWGFYSYYAPRANPWTDFDTGEPDYQMVYPGPRGLIPTRPSEAVREGWQDYCLLSLLKQRGLNAELASILKDYAAGVPLETLRIRALNAAAKR